MEMIVFLLNLVQFVSLRMSMLLADRAVLEKQAYAFLVLLVLLLRLKKQTNVKKAFGDLMRNICQKKDSEC